MARISTGETKKGHRSAPCIGGRDQWPVGLFFFNALAFESHQFIKTTGCISKMSPVAEKTGFLKNPVYLTFFDEKANKYVKTTHFRAEFSALHLSSTHFGAGGVTRTHDLLITKCIGALHLTVFRDFGAFPLGILREVVLSSPLFLSAHLRVWVTVWVKRKLLHQRSRGQASSSYFVLPFLSHN